MKKYVIENDYQKLVILNIGATIHQWFAFKEKTNIVISNEYLSDYKNPKNGYLSSTIGRVTNRIAQGKFMLNNQVYQLEQNFDGNNHGHGGSLGFFNQKFDVVEHYKKKITLKLNSKHLEDGYPGNLTLLVTYELDNNKLKLTYDAISDKTTILNITNHAYFNLSNESNIYNHKIKAPVFRSLETNEYLVPTGTILNNENTLLDFREPKLLKDVVTNKEVYKKSLGLDHFFLFENNFEPLVLSYKNKSLSIKTTYPGLQIYTFQHKVNQPLLNRSYEPYIGIALECSFEPDAINHPNFNSIILNSNKQYLHTIEYVINE